MNTTDGQENLPVYLYIFLKLGTSNMNLNSSHGFVLERIFVHVCSLALNNPTCLNCQCRLVGVLWVSPFLSRLEGLCGKLGGAQAQGCLQSAVQVFPCLVTWTGNENLEPPSALPGATPWWNFTKSTGPTRSWYVSFARYASALRDS